MILVCGEALVDLFVEAGRCEGTRGGLPALAVAGGSPFNLAIGLSRLGACAGFFGGLSSDTFGQMLRDRLTAEGVDVGFAKASTHPTPLAIVAVGADGHPAYTFHAEHCAHADVTRDDLPGMLPAAVSALALGSFSLAMEPVGSTFVALVEREAGRRVISLDPNLRLDLIDDLGGWRRRFAVLMRHADIVKLSDEDRIAAFGAESDEAALAADWLAAGPALVVFTAGAAGATAYHAAGRITVPGRPVRVVDTVGAGDTFHAALLAGLSRDKRLTRDGLAALDANALQGLLHEATAAASITCSRLGADLPTAADLKAFLAEPVL
ncbi:carbohydrate kinase [Beijerinckia sp. L45]|uniref:carbohydrate kinase family protein n=1 Tax=Beijerinckia sp. L45 TaxID=1641855 RepID=UPI00131D3AC8|nr:carbohydrate kinase [Beijerinckia sp. L45]